MVILLNLVKQFRIVHEPPILHLFLERSALFALFLKHSLKIDKFPNHEDILFTEDRPIMVSTLTYPITA